MRIGFGGYANETNGMCGILNTLDMVKSRGLEKEALLRGSVGRQNYCGGFADEAKEQGVEPVPAFYVFFSPSGPSTKEAFEYGRDRLVENLLEAHRQQPLDGIALFLHGAGVAHGYDDLEGAIIRAVREAFGPEMPIALAMDLHGNVTEEMIALVDIATGCKHYPHIDEYKTARETMAHLIEMVRSGKKPYKRLVRLPMHLVVNAGVTTSGPAAQVCRLMQKLEQDDPELLQASAFQGFPYADIPQAAVSVITVGTTQEAADRNAKIIANHIWDHRAEFAVPTYGAREAVALALQAPDGPVLINETSDNPGAGTPGDGTHLLKAFLEADVPAAYGFICDPEVAKQAAQAGVGATIHCRLGGKHMPIYGEPLELDAYVKSVSDGKGVRKSPMGKGLPIDLGTTVCLQVGKVQIVVACTRTQTFDDNPFVLGGVDWRQMRLLGLKSSQHFKGWWADQVQTIIPCDSPGIVSGDLKTLPLTRAPKDYYPLNPNREWTPDF